MEGQMSTMSTIDDGEALLKSLTIEKMVIWHNELAESLGEKKTARFESRAAALTRCRRLMVRCCFFPEGYVSMEKKRRAMVFRYPPTDSVKEARPGTLRAKALSMLRVGATFDSIKQMFKFHDLSKGVDPYNLEGRAYRLIREIHRDLGWGLREEGGSTVKTIHIFDKMPPRGKTVEAHYAA
jgi:hypothetical protein